MISSPLAENVREVVEELHNGSISTIMVTGDAPETALSIATQVGLVDTKDKRVLRVVSVDEEARTVLLEDMGAKRLSCVAGKTPSEPSAVALAQIDAAFRRDASLPAPLDSDPLNPPVLVATGAAIRSLLEPGNQTAPLFLPRIAVFARIAPQEKAAIIEILRNVCHSGEAESLLRPQTREGRARCRKLGINTRSIPGGTCLYVGDGANDVAALRAADAGVALMETMEYHNLS